MNVALNPSPGFKSHPEHTITVEPFEGVVVVHFSDIVVASSEHALVLREADHRAVLYMPFEDIYFEHLFPTETQTHCPFKGDASYWRASAGGSADDDVMWSYKAPFDEMTAIQDHGAFDPKKVRIEATSDDGTRLDV